MFMIDQKDLDILKHLRNDARNQLSVIQKKTKIPISTIHDRIQKMENRGIIKKYTAMINPLFLRQTIHSLCIVKEYSKNSAINTEYILHLPETKAIQVFFHNLEEYKKFKRKTKILKEFQIYETIFEEKMLTR